MSLESITQDQFEAFVQVLKKRLSELDQELRLPSHKRRIEREIEFDKRLIIQSLNAILRYKDQGEIRAGLISNNLFGKETLALFTQFQDAIEKQYQQAQQETGTVASSDETTGAAPVADTLQEAPPALTIISESKAPPQAQPLDLPTISGEDREVTKEEEPAISAAAPADVEISPVEPPAPPAPTKLPEPELETPIPPSQEAKGPVEVVPGASEVAAPQLEEAPGNLPVSPVAMPEKESTLVTPPTTPPEPVIQEQAAPPPSQPSIISQAPFTMPVAEQERLEKEPAAVAEEPGVPWNGTPRVGNIFKGQQASYQLEKSLGMGRYGEVWKAAVVESNQSEFQETSVALKIANPGLTFEERLQFEAEINVLDHLRNQAPENLIRKEGKLLVPEVYEVVQAPADSLQRSFFTQSLASGQPIDEFRRDKPNLPESDALEITAQFCRVLQAVHEGLHMSLVDFQPENIFWDAQNRRIFVIGWENLSKPEQANFTGDVISAASELYRMVVGLPAPIPGSHRALAEPLERWNELSQGVQDILMHAFDPFRLYQTAGEMRKDLEWLGEWWNRPESESLDHFKDLFNSLPQREQLFEKKHEALLEKTLWAAGVLEKIASRPGNDAQPWVIEFRDLRNELNRWQTGTYWLEKGKRSYQARSWDLAEQDFNQALNDAHQGLGATRWLQAVKATRSKESEQKGGQELDIVLVEEAMNFLQAGKFADAAPRLEQLAAKPAQQDFDILAAEARLQENLQRVPGLLEGRRYKELAEVYQKAIEWLGKLPQGYQDILKPGFEDFELKHRQYASLYEKFLELQERFDRLKAARQGEFSEYYEKLKELLDHQPGDTELLKQGKEGIYQYLSQGKFAEGRALTALCLDYNCGADPYLYQVWQYTCQLERCWQAWSSGNGPAFRNALLNQAWPADLWANLVEKIVENSLKLPDQYFVAEFLDEIISSSRMEYANPKIQEQIKLERTRLMSKIDQAFLADEEGGTELLLNLMQVHPYSLTLFNTAAAKVGAMLQQNNFSAALRIAQAAATQFSIRDLKGDPESLLHVLDDLRSFLSAARRILPLQDSWTTNGVVGLAQQLERVGPWKEGARWAEDELVFLRDFLTRCLEKLEKEFQGWNLILTEIDQDDPLYQRLADQREELHQEFREDTLKRLEADPQSGFESLRDLWVKYPVDPILEQDSMEVLGHELLFKDENAQLAQRLFNRLSEFPLVLKERIRLCANYARFYRTYPDNSEQASKELFDVLAESGTPDHFPKEKMAFLEAVHHAWFKQALENEDLAGLQSVYALLPKEKWAKAEVEALSNLRKTYTQKVQSLTDSTSEALKKGEQIEQQPVGLAAKLMGKLQKQPALEDTLSEWDEIIAGLRTWIAKTRQAGWNDESFRLESYLEKLTKLYARIELLTTRKINETNITLIAELWKLALPGTPDDPQGDPKQTPKASEDNRRQWLLQMDKACQELIKTFPKDSQRQVWVGWQSRIQAELRKIQKP